MASDEWRSAQLGQHVDLLVGYAFKSAEFSDDTADVRLLRGANVSQGRLDWSDARYWPERRWGEAAGYELQSGDVVLAMDRPWIEAGLKHARISRSDLPALLVQRVACLRARPSLDQGFLYYLIGSPSFTQHVLAVQTGSTVPHISGAQIREYAFLLPPRPEQVAIGEVLGALDGKVDSNRRSASLLRDLAAAAYEGHVLQHPDRDDWEVIPLGDLMSLDKGVSYKGAFLGEGRPMVNLGCFKGTGQTDWTNLKHYSGHVKPRHEVGPGDLVIANTDMTQNRVVLGSAALVPEGLDGAVISHHVYAARWKHPERDLARLVYFALLQESFRRRARGFATGTTVLGLPRDTVLEYEISVPPPSLLAPVDAMWATTFETLWQLEQENARLDDIRDTLLPKLVSGDVRIPDPARLLEAVA